jgi:hypothetical protein
MADPTILDYRVYVLRCWREPVPEGGAQVAPRFNLEDPNTGHRHGFTRAVDLVEFLERSLVYDEPTDASTPTTLRPLRGEPGR